MQFIYVSLEPLWALWNVLWDSTVIALFSLCYYNIHLLGLPARVWQVTSSNSGDIMEALLYVKACEKGGEGGGTWQTGAVW